jgi:hypothetical protein
MTRDADAQQITLSKEDVYRPFILVELQLDTGTVYVCSLDRDIVFNSNTYLGVGNFGKIGMTKETAGSESSGISMELSGIPDTYINITKDEDYHGRTCIVRQGFLDENFELSGIGDPPVLFQGIIDQMMITLGKSATVVLTAEDDWIRWEEPLKSLYTNEEQQHLFAGDLGLEFVNQVVDKELIWGRS